MSWLIPVILSVLSSTVHPRGSSPQSVSPSLFLSPAHIFLSSAMLVKIDLLPSPSPSSGAVAGIQVTTTTPLSYSPHTPDGRKQATQRKSHLELCFFTPHCSHVAPYQPPCLHYIQSLKCTATPNRCRSFLVESTTA